MTRGFTVKFFMERIWFIINAKIKMEGYYGAIANSCTITMMTNPTAVLNT